MLIAATSIVFGLLLAAADRFGRRTRVLHEVTLADAVFIGLAQALALVPGTSRSGITMTAGIAAQPAPRGCGAVLVPARGAGGRRRRGLGGDRIRARRRSGRAAGQLLLVVVVSAIVGVAVIHFLLGFLRRRSLIGFAVYRVALGIVILVAIYGPWRG